jgi:signal transduction histidine kinase/CheY-like chemotaxis protein
MLAQLVPVIRELSRARTIEDVQRIVRHAARSLTGADGATFVLRDGDQCYYADEDAIAPLWKGRRFPMKTCVSGWVMLHAQPAVIEDIYADERIPADAYRPTFVKSLAVVPIRSDCPIGAIGNYWATRRKPTTGEVELLQALADSTSTALENVQLYADLQLRIGERTSALEQAQHELDDRKRAEAELVRVESQLRQSQKMEGIGRLAGGIAHDFNNMLSVILTYSSLVRSELDLSDPLRADVEEILRAGERASGLTRQLLAFSRQQVLAPQQLVLNDIVQGVENMLRRVLGEDVQLESRLLPDLYPTLSDPGQVEQILMNLIINARDAMPQGGRISVETNNVRVRGPYASEHYGVAEGDYALLAVSDTGTGMDRETQAKIFEPFFTTKEKGKGTGLGLSTVYGIVKQSGGHIWVYSEPGCGTTFKLYFPRLIGASQRPSVAPLDAGQFAGSETILLVEDDEPVRDAVFGILHRHGYNVLQAKNAGEAMLICQQFPSAIHLMLTDVVMPMMSGTQLAKRLTETRPSMKVLCMSGFTDDVVIHHGLIDSNLAFIQKPVTPEGLLSKVRSVVAA